MDARGATPVEQVPIELFGGVVLVVRAADASLWLAVHDLSLAVDLAPRAQRRRIQTNVMLARYAQLFHVDTGGGPQTQLFLQLEGVGLWLMTINVSKASDAVRERLLWLQEHLADAVRRAFAEATGLPDRSAAIEDVDELGRIDVVLQGVLNHQRTNDTRHEQLRAEVAAIAARVRALEGSAPPQQASPISKAQRGAIYQLVLTWADQLQHKNEGMSAGAARATCWATFKRRFALAAYEHLPASRYSEAVAFIQHAYAELGGGDLPTQASLDLEGR